MIRKCIVCETEYDHQSKKTCSKTCFKVHKNSRERLTRESNRGSYLLNGVKARAKRKCLPFNLTLDDIVIPSTCPILGIPIKHSSNNRPGPVPNSPSVDRIYPALGYVKGNIQIISQKANQMKQDATPDELLMFADWVHRNV